MGTDQPLVEVVGLGMGEGPLSQRACEMASTADVLAGGERELALFPNFCGTRVAVRSPLADAFAAIKEHMSQGRSVVVFTSGDPLYYGLGRQLIAALGPQKVRVHPGSTAVQAAAARLRIPWDDMAVVSLHGRSNMAALFAAISRNNRVAVYTDPGNTPALVARALLERGADCVAMNVLENMGSDAERFRQLSLAEAASQQFAPLNVVILEKSEAPPAVPRLGLPDDALEHHAGLITKWPVRAAALAALALPEQGVMWDIGAASGSVAIEAVALMPGGAIHAVERHPDRAAMLRRNLRRFHAFQVQAVQADARMALHELPDPDRIFIGGGLGSSQELLLQCCQRLRHGGVVVAAAVLLETLEAARSVFSSLGWETDIVHLAASRSAPLAGGMRLTADNPVFLVRGVKP